MDEHEFREKLAAFMMFRALATGHGDTVDDLLSELDWQLKELRNRSNGVSSARSLHRLDAMLYSRPAGRNIIEYAMDELRRLRQELYASETVSNSVTLNLEELRDVAELLEGHSESDEDWPDTEITIQPCCPEGVVDDDGGPPKHYRYVAVYTEYPEEGVIPLGRPISKEGGR